MMPEQKSYLRGQRYHREKTAGHGQSAHQNDGQTTAQRLGQQYGVGEATIERDGAFAEAVDALEQEVRRDLRKCRQNAPLQGRLRPDSTRAGAISVIR
jgi:hypothetical protein